MASLQGRYRADIRSSFRRYALFPVILLVCLSFAAVLFFSYRSVADRSRTMNGAFVSLFDQLAYAYRKEAQELAEDPRVHAAVAAGCGDAELYASLYGFVNRQSVRCEFYIFGAEMQPILASTNNKPSYADYPGFQTRLLEAGRESALSVEKGTSGNVVCIGMAILEEQAPLGYILFEMTEENFRSLFAEREMTDILVLSRYDRVCWSTNASLVNNLGKTSASFTTGDGFSSFRNAAFYSVCTSAANGDLKIISVMDFSTYTSMFAILALFLFLILILVSFGVVLASDRIARKKTAAIDVFVHGIQRLQAGCFEEISLHTGDEFEEMAAAFNSMLQNIQRLMRDNEEKAYLSAASELKQLEAQFNSHFLFNTLEVIRYNLYLEPQTVEKTIVDLSSLLRYSLNGDTEVPLSEELRYVRSYFDIQRVRLDDSFRVEWSVMENAYDCRVPKLLIQPIVENAFKYGFRGQQGFLISVEVSVCCEKLIIRVANNGPQIHPEDLERIVRNMNEGTEHPKHFGLYGVHKRLRLLYGEDYGLAIESGDEQTCVTVTVPRRTEGSEKRASYLNR